MQTVDSVVALLTAGIEGESQICRSDILVITNVVQKQ